MYGTGITVSLDRILESKYCEGNSHLIVSDYMIFEFLVLESKFDVVSFPVVVKKFVGYFVFLFEAELDSDARNTSRLAHISNGMK